MTRTIAVSGSASGLGKATAELLEAQGNRVIRIDLTEGDIVADLSTRAGRAAAIAGLHEATTVLDGLGTWAGLGRRTITTAIVNYYGSVELIEGARALLLRSAAPRVVLTSSRMSLEPADQQLVSDLLTLDADAIVSRYPEDVENTSYYYRASKTALARWMRRTSISPEWGGSGIAMNAIAPGLIETPMTAVTLDNPATHDGIIKLHPQADRTLSQPPEIAALTAFLLSEPAGLLIGQCIWADRGTEAIIRGDEIW